MSGWNVSQDRGFISFVASPFSGPGLKIANEKLRDYCSKKGTKFTPIQFEVTSGSGNVFERWIASVTFQATGEEKVYRVFYHRPSGKLYFKELGMVASHKPNPNSPRNNAGGYFGKAYVAK